MSCVVNVLMPWGQVAVRWTLAGLTVIMGKVDRQGVTYEVEADGIQRLWRWGLEELLLWLALLAMFVAVACYVIGKIRPKPVQKERDASQWLLKCCDLHSQGELSDEEFRTIKTTLAAQLQDELSDNGDES